MDARIGLITGFTSGIGREAATALARSGMRLIGVSRTRERGEAAAAAIRAAGGGSEFHLLIGDLASLSDVRALAREVGDRFDHLDLLINNAGGIFMTRRETPDGLEMTLAVNHLAPFLLTHLLWDRLRAAGRARVVTVASEAHRFGRPNWDDLQMRQGYHWGKAYALSKLANILFTFELARRLEGTGVTANCMHPGGVNTELWREARGGLKVILVLGRPFMISPVKGAAGVIRLASDPALENVTGRYFKRTREGVASPLARDGAAARRLWEMSAALVGLREAGPGAGGDRTGDGRIPASFAGDVVIEAVLWDNDGVLVDSETVFFEVTREAFAGLGLALSPDLWMKSYLGAGKSSREIALSLGGDPARVERMLEERNETHRRRLAGVAMRPGVKETLAALEGKVKMAMVTSSPRYQIDIIHRSTGLLGHFACIVTSDECPRLKPAPDAYLMAAQRLGVSPERCVAVEDSYRGFSAARAAGIRCLLVPHELTDVAACAGAFRVERDVRGLIPLVAGDGQT